MGNLLKPKKLDGEKDELIPMSAFDNSAEAPSTKNTKLVFQISLESESGLAILTNPTVMSQMDDQQIEGFRASNAGCVDVKLFAVQPSVFTVPQREGNSDKKTLNISLLSNDILSLVLSFLHVRELVCHVALSCKRIHRIVENESTWYSLLVNHTSLKRLQLDALTIARGNSSKHVFKRIYAASCAPSCEPVNNDSSDLFATRIRLKFSLSPNYSDDKYQEILKSCTKFCSKIYRNLKHCIELHIAKDRKSCTLLVRIVEQAFVTFDNRYELDTGEFKSNNQILASKLLKDADNVAKMLHLLGMFHERDHIVVADSVSAFLTNFLLSAYDSLQVSMPHSKHASHLKPLLDYLPGLLYAGVHTDKVALVYFIDQMQSEPLGYPVFKRIDSILIAKGYESD